MKKQVKKILIAEDEAPIARALQLKLEKAGYKADIAIDGVEALRKLVEDEYDLLLLDLMMPGKDGFLVLQEITQIDPDIRVIVSSNLSQDEDKNKAKELGADDYFVKSDTPLSEVIKNVDKVLSK